MMPWNRRELWTGRLEQQGSEIRSLLKNGGIPYDLKVRAEKNALTGCRIYVHKYEYEKAANLIRRALKKV